MTNDTAIWNSRLIFFLGVNTGFVSDRQPNDRFVEFYRERSSSRLHSAIVGNVVVPGGHASNQSTPFIGPNPIWSELADAISAQGTLPGIQLATAWEGYEGARNFLSADGQNVIKRARELVKSFGTSGIERTLKSFRTAAALAVDHGFRHIQLHAAHGYLLNLLVDDRINPKAEKVRALLAELADWLHSKSVESSLRVSMRTGDDQFDEHGSDELLDRLASLPFDFVDLSSGFYNINKRLIYPSLDEVITSRLSRSIDVAKRNPRRQFVISGRISLRVRELPRNAHVGICRDLIANPRFLAEPDNGCRNHNKCHYFSRREDHITCSRWNETTA